MAGVVGAGPSGWPSARFSIGPVPRRAELIAVAAVLLGFLAMALVLLAERGPLGHDEAVYALRAETFRLGEPAGSTWAGYRAPGLPFVAQFAGSSEAGMRLVTTGFGLVLLVATWIFGRLLFGPAAGVTAAAGVALTPLILRSSVQIWPDVPGAALGMLAIAVLACSTAGDRVSWWAFAVPPLVGAATIVRFGAPANLAFGLGAVALWRLEAIRRSPVRAVAAGVLSAVAAAVVLLVPSATGNDPAPLSAIGARSREWFEGFADFAVRAGELIGSPAGVALLTGVVAAVLLARRGRIPRGALAAALGGGVGSGLITAVLLHGELRYLAPTIPLLWAAAGAGLAGLAAVVTLPRAEAGVLAAALLGAMVVSALDLGYEANRVNKARYSSVRTAAERVGEAAAGGSCGVVTGYGPQVGWYSGCLVAGFPGSGPTPPRWLESRSDVVFLFRVEDGKRQPEASAWREAADDGALQRIFAVDEGDVVVYRYRG